MTGYHVAPYHGKLDRVYPAYADEIENTKAGYKPTWDLGEPWARHMVQDAHCQEMPPTHYTGEEGAVQLGNKAIGDLQREADNDAGGLVAQALRGYGYKNG